MSIIEARCVYKGAVFVGTLEVSGMGPDETVHVHYEGDCIGARTFGLDVASVAPMLLRELVMEKSAARSSERVGIQRKR